VVELEPASTVGRAAAATRLGRGLDHTVGLVSGAPVGCLGVCVDWVIVLFDIDMYDEGICGRLFCLDRRNGMFAYRCP
jgi:hypothetical protein